MKVLAFDQSSRVTGWSFFEDNKYVCSGVIDKHKIYDADKRIGEMGTAVCHHVKNLAPDVVVIEDVQQQSGAATVILLARLQGFILGWCYVHNIDVKIIKPSEWRAALQFKQGAGVKRQELKAQGMKYAKEKYGLDAATEDECESVCINDGARIKFGLEEDDIWAI